MKRAGFAQLSAIALALVFVLTASGYGIARGFTAEDTSYKYSACRPPPPSEEECGWVCYLELPENCR